VERTTRRDSAGAEQAEPGLKGAFRRFACVTSEAAGSLWAFLVAFGVVVLWGVTGPIFHFSDSWQLIINTGTTVVTFLMVFLIQATQNRETRALHLKIDELIRSQRRARNTFAGVENATDEELKEMESEFRKLRARAEARAKSKRPTEAR
jgi:low affinity Fe/Cu permease